MNHESERVSTRSLLGAFLAVVVLCAVFFSLGFFLGYRQGHPGGALTTEQIPAASDIPAEVNPTGNAEPSGSSGEPAAPEAPSSTAASPRAATESSPPASDSAPAEEQEVKPAPAADEGQLPASAFASRVPTGLLVQVAAVTNQQDAANVLEVLKSKDYPALILTPAQAKAQDNFYRVVSGPYKSRTEAERVRKELTAEGFKPFIR
jgi:cell division septation protein DedD